jgi:hypothetical protein
VLVLGIELILFFVVISVAIHWLKKNSGSSPRPQKPEPRKSTNDDPEMPSFSPIIGSDSTADAHHDPTHHSGHDAGSTHGGFDHGGFDHGGFDGGHGGFDGGGGHH